MGWQVDPCKEIPGREGVFRQEDPPREDFRGDFGGRGGNPKVDRTRSAANWDPPVVAGKGGELKKGWVILVQIWGCFDLRIVELAFGAYKLGTMKPDALILECVTNAKKKGHMTSGCLEKRKIKG